MLSPLTFDQLVALGSFALSVVLVIQAGRRDSDSDDERKAARAAEQQVVTDKLDSISEMSRETRDTVREMSKQLQDHSRELARIETTLEEHGRRITAIERKDTQ